MKQALHRAILVLRLGHEPLGCLEHIFNSCGHCGCALAAHASAAAAAAATTSAQQQQHIYVCLLRLVAGTDLAMPARTEGVGARRPRPHCKDTGDGNGKKC